MLTKTAKAEWTSPATPSHRGWSARGGDIGRLAILALLAAVSTVVLAAAVVLGTSVQIARGARRLVER